MRSLAAALAVWALACVAGCTFLRPASAPGAQGALMGDTLVSHADVVFPGLT